jgi:hypothetical protein
VYNGSKHPPAYVDRDGHGRCYAARRTDSIS